MKRRMLILLAIPPMIVAGLWIRSERMADLVMRRAPVVVAGAPIDLSRGIVSTQGCILFRRIIIFPGRTKHGVWDWTVTHQSQLPEIRSAANRLGFGSSGITIQSADTMMKLADSWIPYWLVEIVAGVPLLVAIPYVGSAPRTIEPTARNADPTENR